MKRHPVKCEFSPCFFGCPKCGGQVECAVSDDGPPQLLDQVVRCETCGQLLGAFLNPEADGSWTLRSERLQEAAAA
jgi:hypothetical protein